MRKFILAIALFSTLAIPSIVSAATTTAQLRYVESVPFTVNNFLLSSVTSTGASSTTINLQLPMSKHMCSVTWGGTVPTSITISVDGSMNNSSFASLASVTVTESPTIFHIDKPGVMYLRGNYVTRVGGDATTSVTLECSSGGI